MHTGILAGKAEVRMAHPTKGHSLELARGAPTSPAPIGASLLTYLQQWRHLYLRMHLLATTTAAHATHRAGI